MTRTLFILGLLAMSGCTTSIRNVTAESWSDDGVYVAYWEGTCKPVLGCDRGDGFVNWCKLNESTNELSCRRQDAISPLLARKPGAAPPPAAAPAPAPKPTVEEDEGATDEAAPEAGATEDDAGEEGAEAEGADESVPAEGEEAAPTEGEEAAPAEGEEAAPAEGDAPE